jgi:phosphatidate cytidylyltransferase
MNTLDTTRPALRLMVALFATLTVATVLSRGRTWQLQVSAWWRLMPVVFVAWWLGPAGVWVMVMLIGFLASRELAAHAEAQQAGPLRHILLLSVLPFAALGAFYPSLAAALAALCAAGLWLVYRQHHHVGPLLLGLFALQAAGMWCLMLLARWPAGDAPAAAWFLYVCTITALNDIGQFVCGKLWGRHALNNNISPNKTWQGAFGGLVVSMAASVAVGATLGLASVPALLSLGVLLCITGLLGDLLFSAGKRTLRIKDYGSLIPGHGGILDRVDSLVLTAPTLWLALHLF